ncbi:MAG TPA: glycosyltransferase [Bacteroidia bacterium]|nr:glycosyltransferase [Bacteroidia bacterium]
MNKSDIPNHNPIRVLRIINRFNLGGPTYNVAYLSKYLSADFETLLVGGAKDDSEESSDFIVNNLGLKPIIIEEMQRSINLKKDWAAYLKLKKIIQEFKPDIVHTHASKAGTLGRLAASSCGVPLIVHTFHGHVFHSYFGKLKTTFYKNIERFLAKKSTAIIAISEKQKEELTSIHRICNPEKVVVIPLGFDLSKFQVNQEAKRKAFRDRYRVSDDELVVSIIGRLVSVKNHALFLEGIKRVSEKTSQKIRAFIVGDGENRELIEAKAQSLGLAFSDAAHSSSKTILTFTSWIKDIDIALAGSDIITLTSFNEGTPVSLIEAQAANKPIVSTNVGGIENVVLPGITALLCKNDDVDEFTEQLLKITESETTRDKMAQEGWKHVKEKFHFTRLVNDMELMYRKLLRK